MTSASELFYNRRWRAGRREQPVVGLDRSSPDQDHCRRRSQGGRLGREGVDRSCRRSHAGRVCDRRPQAELDSIWLESRTLREHGIVRSPGSGSNRLRYTGNERLPGVVVQAQARLLERLRGISLSDRQPSVATRTTSWNELEVGNDNQDLNSGVYVNQNPGDLLESGSLSTSSSAGRDEGFHSFTDHKRHQELSWEDLCSVQLEVYRDGMEHDNTVKASPDCSICLERFLEGDELIRLECGHRFHSSCLEPWLRTCRDCPYCRRRI